MYIQVCVYMHMLYVYMYTVPIIYIIYYFLFLLLYYSIMYMHVLRPEQKARVVWILDVREVVS